MVLTKHLKMKNVMMKMTHNNTFDYYSDIVTMIMMMITVQFNGDMHYYKQHFYLGGRQYKHSSFPWRRFVVTTAIIDVYTYVNFVYVYLFLCLCQETPLFIVINCCLLLHDLNHNLSCKRKCWKYKNVIFWDFGGFIWP